jgi:hypothetical protein
MRHDSDSPIAPLPRGSMKPPGSEKSYTARAAANLRWYSCESVRDKLRRSFGIAGTTLRSSYSEQNVPNMRSHTLVITPKLHGVLP